MPRSKRPRKKHRPTPVKTPMMIKSRDVLAPIEAIIEQIERDGTVTQTIKGMPIFKTPEGHYSSTVCAIEGLVHAFELCETRFRTQLPLEPLREFCRGLPYDWPVTEAMLGRLKMSLAALRKFLNWVDEVEMARVVQTVQIADELRRAKDENQTI